MSAEVEDLKSGETAVEERARSELGMIKPGETFYRVVEPHAVRAPEDGAVDPVAPADDAAAADPAATAAATDATTGDADAPPPDAPSAPGTPR